MTEKKPDNPLGCNTFLWLIVSWGFWLFAWNVESQEPYIEIICGAGLVASHFNFYGMSRLQNIQDGFKKIEFWDFLGFTLSVVYIGLLLKFLVLDTHMQGLFHWAFISIFTGLFPVGVCALIQHLFFRRKEQVTVQYGAVWFEPDQRPGRGSQAPRAPQLENRQPKLRLPWWKGRR